jgi:hypothetical protein
MPRYSHRGNPPGLSLSAARRIVHNAFSTPMPPVRSLHYFLPLIAERLERPLGYRDLDDLRRKLPAALRR